MSAQTFLGKAFGLDSIAELGGILFVKVRPNNLNQQKMNEIKRSFGYKCFTEFTTELVGYSEAAENRLPVWEYGSPNAQNAANTKQYQNITHTFLGKFQNHGHVKEAGRS